MNDVEKYILMRKEIEMGNQISDENKPFFDKMNGYYESDLEFKNMIDMTLAATNRKDMNAIINGTKNIDENKTILIPVEEIINQNEQVNISDEVPSGGTERAKQKIKSRNGYADALILALVTGFICGTSATILFILM